MLCQFIRWSSAGRSTTHATVTLDELSLSNAPYCRQCYSQGLMAQGQGLRSEDKDFSVYANWTTAGTLFAIKNKNNVRAMKH